ncbi:AAA family ATPase [Georgenia deserti]|uniref:AAA family ATPase n=1 Tax=Georgenia deserti TaxID=2093781 RepID=A0ABW4KYV3_9MICO
MRVLWLYGPPAVGKSVTAWELLNSLAAVDPATGYVDIDQVGMSYVDEDEDPEAHKLKGRALAAVAAEFAGHGVRTLIVSGVLDPGLTAFYAEVLGPYDPIFVRLTASNLELQRRLSTRGVYAEEWADVEEHARRLDAAAPDHPVIESVPGNPAQVAGRVLKIVGALVNGGSQSAHGASASVGDEASVHGRAILIGGTTAVGKSTVGWQAFMATRQQGRPSSFVDLRQLGFVGIEGGVINHRLQARAARALWRVFRSHGAEVVILNGPVNSSDEMLTYRAALEGIEFAAIRLTADPPALLDRVQARMRGEMAPLAGDPLVGRPADEAESIVDAAVRLQNSGENDARFPALDTTALDPAESAQRVLSSQS